MFINHLKVALRNLLKNKVHSGINIFGLAVGFAASLVIFLFADNELTYDAFHENAESIFQVYKERITPTGTQITRDTWVPLARELKSQYPSIIEATRFWTNTDWVQFRDRRFQENVAYVDPSFLKIFTFPLVKGDARSVFSDIHSVIISQPMVEKHFGDENPIGKTITINYETVYTIRGVLDEIPQNSIVQMDFLVLIESAPDYKEIVDSWRNSFLSTYIQLSRGASPAALEAQLPGFVTKIWDEELNKSMILRLTPLLGLYNELSDANTYAYILLAIACVILFIASINSMNLTTARSLERAREIGLRKVLGAFRHQLIKQFLNESLIISALALVVGIGLLEFFLPVFNSYYDMSLTADYLGNLNTLLVLLSLGLLVGLLSGFYPAFVISRYQPNESLKGHLKTSRRGLRLRYGLLITQFCLAIVLMIGTGIMWKQIRFMKNANLNFDQENLIVIPVRQSDFQNQEQAQIGLETLKNELRQYAGIKSVSSSTHIPGKWPGWFIFAYPTDRDDSQRLRVRSSFIDANYSDTYGIEFVEGRNFSETLTTDAQESLIINEAALRDIGWHSAKGRQIRIGRTVYNVIGVVKDYHFQSLASKVAPVFHFFRTPENGVHRFISVKIADGNVSAILDFIKHEWEKLDPTRAFEFIFADENFARLYENENRLTTIASSFAVLAILIACLGLFALTSLMVTQRTKEIGVRKTLGASVTGIVFLLSRVFTWSVGISFVIATPIAFFVGRAWLADFAYRTDIGLEIFIAAGILSLTIAFITVSYHSIKAALANPVEALRYE